MEDIELPVIDVAFRKEKDENYTFVLICENNDIVNFIYPKIKDNIFMSNVKTPENILSISIKITGYKPFIHVIPKSSDSDMYIKELDNNRVKYISAGTMHPNDFVYYIPNGQLHVAGPPIRHQIEFYPPHRQ